MTIGIATRGPGAGLAAWRALLAAELLGRGEIGGFCVFAWRDGVGEIRHATTQRGGTSGLTLPDGWAKARHAALISSGPDRPEPLTQFLPGNAGGLVTGHRLPTSPLPDGRPVNLAALEAMAQGRLTQAGLEALLSLGPAMDAGLICLPWSGPVLAANSPRVEGRGDTGRHVMQQGDTACAILYNSIATVGLPGDALAKALGAIAAEVMGLGPAPLAFGQLPDRVPVTPASQEAVEIDASGLVTAIHSADPAYFGPKPGITAVYARVPIWQSGRHIGWAASEAFADLRGGVLIARPGLAQRCFLYERTPT